jgi:hypothetical protein
VISDETRTAVMRRAGYRCEYCSIEGWELQVDHIIARSPRRAIGETRTTEDIALPENPADPSNLAAACAHCNRLKRDLVAGVSVLFGGSHRLFNPRGDQWTEHLTWSDDCQRILPLSPIGDATLQHLAMNARIFRRQRDLLRRVALAGGPAWP